MDNRFAKGAAYIEGNYVPLDEARIPIRDWGFIRSDATYDVAHVWKGRFFRLDDHLERLLQSMARLRLKPREDREAIRAIAHEVVACSGLSDALVQMVCTRGVPVPGSRDPRLCVNQMYVFSYPFVWIANPEKQEIGLNVVVSRIQRIPAASVDPTIKNFHWLDLVQGLFEAYDKGGDNVVLVDGAGNVVEGAGFNIFSVREGRLATPESGMLEGVTRRTALEVAKELRVPVDIRAVSEAEFRAADEAFITSTAGGVMPVTRVDGAALGNGKPGPVTLAIRARYWELHDDPRYATPVRAG